MRVGGSPLTATVANSASAVAQLATQAATGQTVTVQIAPGSSQSGTRAQGGIEFDPLSAGSSTVSSTIPGFLTLPTSQKRVTVTP